MKFHLSILLLTVIALASSDRCKDRGHEPWPRCQNPCHDSEEPDIETILISPVQLQKIRVNTVLVCSPGSYFERIEYDEGYQVNTTCNGIQVTQGDSWPNYYTGIKANRHGKHEEEVTLDAGKWTTIKVHLNGNIQRAEDAELVNYECGGDIIKTHGSWVADNPLTGCCTKGVNHVTGTSFKLNIWGKCCSECCLVQSSQSWKHPDRT